MATKAEIFKSVLAICEKHDVPATIVAELAEVLKPKTGGAQVNLEEVTKTNKNGEITELLCSVSGVFLPATTEFFYEDKSGKGINGLRRLSRQAEAIRKDFTRTQKASEKAIMEDVLNGDLTVDEGKEAIAALKANQPDYSSVAA